MPEAKLDETFATWVLIDLHGLIPKFYQRLHKKKTKPNKKVKKSLRWLSMNNINFKIPMRMNK